MTARVRIEAARYAIEAAECKEPVMTWLIDGAGFFEHARTLSAFSTSTRALRGKITNYCQVAVSLAVTTASEQLLIDFELHLPEAWAKDPPPRAEGRIPSEGVFKTKIELAIDRRARASAAHLSDNIILAESAREPP